MFCIDVLETASATHSSPLLFNLLEITRFGVQSDVHKQKLDPFFSLSGCNQRWSGGGHLQFPKSHYPFAFLSLGLFTSPGKKNPGKIICTVNF